MDTNNARTWSERRRLERLERERAAYWEQLRRQQAGGVQGEQQPATSGPAVFPSAPAEPAAPARTAGVPRLRLPLAARVVVAAVVATVVVGGATPLAGEGFRPIWLAVGAIAFTLVAFTVMSAWRTSTPAGRWVSVGLAGFIIVAAGVGALTQTSVDGRVQIRGTRLDRAVAMQDELNRAVEVLSDNQRLLYLSSEQALGLTETFREATRQAVLIGEIWNPATVGGLPLEEFLPAVELVNLAAARQAAAFENYLTNLAAPEPAVAQKATDLTAEVAGMLDVDIPAALEVTADLLGVGR